MDQTIELDEHIIALLYGEIPCPNLFGSPSAYQSEKRLLINKL